MLATFTRWHGQARRWQTFTLEIISRQIAESPLFTDLPAVIIQDNHYYHELKIAIMRHLNDNRLYVLFCT